MNRQLLKDVLRVPTCSREETLMVTWLTDYFRERGFQVSRDNFGNVYVTKGSSEHYPCVCAHTDTVHVRENFLVMEEGDRLYGFSSGEMRCGIGGDDKAGIFVCLDLLERLEVCKAAFFVSEEIGCVGSRNAEGSFFSDVGYLLEFDSPCDDIMTYSCDGTILFPTEGEFFDLAWPQIKAHGVTDWQHHPYTDVAILKRRFHFPCLNLPAGYFRMHSVHEYVQVSVVEMAIHLGHSLIRALGNKFYPFEAEETHGRSVKTPVPVGWLRTHEHGERNGPPPQVICET